MQTSMNKSELTDKRKELRNHSTAAEATLWKLLKGSQVSGLKFRRQHSVGPYILDFYCPQIKLAIELDGEVHNRQVDYDEQRSNYIKIKEGIEVLRFENRTVFENAELIIQQIEEYASPTTSPLKGYSSSQEEENGDTTPIE